MFYCSIPYQRCEGQTDVPLQLTVDCGTMGRKAGKKVSFQTEEDGETEKVVIATLQQIMETFLLDVS